MSLTASASTRRVHSASRRSASANASAGSADRQPTPLDLVALGGEQRATAARGRAGTAVEPLVTPPQRPLVDRSVGSGPRSSGSSTRTGLNRPVHGAAVPVTQCCAPLRRQLRHPRGGGLRGRREPAGVHARCSHRARRAASTGEPARRGRGAAPSGRHAGAPARPASVHRPTGPAAREVGAHPLRPASAKSGMVSPLEIVRAPS